MKDINRQRKALFAAFPHTIPVMAGYLFLGAVHLGWPTILGADWDAFRAERGRA